jgi:hypothetical protein
MLASLVLATFTLERVAAVQQRLVMSILALTKARQVMWL